MTDNRIEKIRAEIERLYNQSLADENRQADRGLERAASVSYGKSKACKELLSFIDSLQEEPVGEELKDVANKYGKDTFVNECMENGVCDNYDLADAFEAGAKWQKEQDQSTIELAEDHAMLAGMEKMKEELMAKAVEVTVHIEAGNYPYIPQMEFYDYDNDVPLAKEGDKYKVVLIKE
jgi:hypothetical protein